MDGILLTPTKDVLEYKNGYFATIWKVMYRDKHLGWYYEDKGVKNWFQFFVKDSKQYLFADIVKELSPSTTCFGEDCIYTHGIYAADKLAKAIHDKFY